MCTFSPDRGYSCPGFPDRPRVFPGTGDRFWSQHVAGGATGHLGAARRLYVTLCRRVYPRLPAWLRTETVALTWKDLRLPALLAVICVILGILIIT